MVAAQKFIRSGLQLLSASGSVSTKITNRNFFNFNSFRCISISNIHLSDRRFTEKHEWVSIIGDIGTVGISNYAQESLGDIVFAQLPDVGTILSLKQECGALESVKAASEIFSPVSGTVIEKNTEVEDSPGLINSNCFDKGWLFKVKISDAKELENLLDEKKYEQFLKTEEH